MVTNEFLVAAADFYGPWTLDELADRFGVDILDLIEHLEDVLEENYDDIADEMRYTTDDEDDD